MCEKVCIITTVHKAFDIRIFHKEAKALAKAGYDVTLICLHDKNDFVDGIKIIGLSMPLSRFHRIFGSTFRFFKAALKCKADIYHFHDPDFLIFGLMLKLFTKAKVIYDIHEDYLMTIATKQWLPSFSRNAIASIYGVLEKISAMLLDGVIPAGLEIGERLRPISRKMSVIQNFPTLDEFMLNTNSNRSIQSSRRIIAFGGISKARSIVEIIEAMGLISDNLDARLILGGKSDSVDLEKELSQISGWKRVDYLGVIPRQKMEEIMLSSDISLVLYSPKPNHYDVRSNRFYESLAVGLPVIVSDFPKWRRMVEECSCGLAVNPEDPKAIATAIEYLLTHSDEAREMGNRGKQAVLTKYNWLSESKKLLAFYSDILK